MLWLLVLGCKPADPSTLDEDGDGFVASEDCDDLDATIHPDVRWDPGADDVDQDCDGFEGMERIHIDDLPFKLIGPGDVRLSGAWSLCDTDGDRIQDLVVLEGDKERTATQDPRLFVYRGPLTGLRGPDSFDSQHVVPGAGYDQIVCTDVDGDDLEDVVLGGSNAAIVYHPFGGSQTVAHLPSSFYDLVVDDFDGDGRADVVGDRTGFQGWVLPGGSYTGVYDAADWPGVEVYVPSDAYSIGDTDGDDDAEIVFVTSEGVLVLDDPRDPTGHASHRLSQTRSVAGDFDGDGRSDDLVALDSGQVLYGPSGFEAFEPTPSIQITTAIGTADIQSFGDLDGDGRADPVILDDVDNSLVAYVLSTEAMGKPGRDRLHLVTRFELEMPFARGRLARFRAGDIDGDGLQDLLFGRGPHQREDEGPSATFYGWLSGD